MEEPLLFIPTPPAYFIEVKVEEKEEAEDTMEVQLEESTSLYEIARAERIENPVIARQLHYFSQPVNRRRILIFNLKNGESIRGNIQKIEGINVNLKMNNQLRIINGNEIEEITASI